MKFTKTSVAALRVPAGKIDHFEWDDSTPGFGIRLRGTRRTWIAQLRVHGRTRRLALGDVAQIELDAARTAAKRFFAESTLGKDPLTERAQARARAANTVGAIVEQYLATRESVARPNTRRHQVRYLRRFFAPLHSSPIDSVTRRDVAFELARLTEEHGKSSARHARSVLRFGRGRSGKELPARATQSRSRTTQTRARSRESACCHRRRFAPLADPAGHRIWQHRPAVFLHGLPAVRARTSKGRRSISARPC
jgi:hypothetical protein